MNFENFAYWLKGFFELTNSKDLSPAQVKMIKEHLDLCFNKMTPPLQKEPDGTLPPLIKIPATIKYADHSLCKKYC